MGWYKKAAFGLDNSNQEAKSLGIRYDGDQLDQGKLIGKMYTDPITKSSFLVRTGQNLQQKLQNIRNNFGK